MNSSCPLAMPEAVTDVEQGKHNLDVFGITIHRNFLTKGQTEALRERVEEQAELEREQGVATFAYDESDRNIVDDYYNPYVGQPVGLPKLQRISLLVNKGAGFIELAQNPVALAYAKHALRGMPFNVGSQSGVIIRTGAPAQMIHNDQQHIPFQTPVPLGVNILVALSDYAEDMGATRFVPGTQTHAPPDVSRDPGSIETFPAVLEPGSALIWESRVWHGQGASTSPKTRFSVITQYILHFMRMADCHPSCIHDDIYAEMTEEQRALYGFVFTGVGRIGPRHPGDTRVNVGSAIPFLPKLERDTGE